MQLSRAWACRAFAGLRALPTVRRPADFPRNGNRLWYNVSITKREVGVMFGKSVVIVGIFVFAASAFARAGFASLAQANPK